MGKTVYATMAGDIFHAGHIKFIKAAKKLGDTLIIGLHPNDVIKKYKHKNPIISYTDRKKIIESISEVDLVVKDCMDFKSPTMFENLKKYNVDILTHGVDWVPPLYKKATIRKLCKVVLLDTLYTSSTKIKEKIKNEL